ncbi:MAG: hypothetical protein AB8B80_09845 [Marinicellaceae bacterium]
MLHNNNKIQKSIIFATKMVYLRQKAKQKLLNYQSVANMVTSFEAGYFSFPSTKQAGHLNKIALVNPS